MCVCEREKESVCIVCVLCVFLVFLESVSYSSLTPSIMPVTIFVASSPSPPSLPLPLHPLPPSTCFSFNRQSSLNPFPSPSHLVPCIPFLSIYFPFPFFLNLPLHLLFLALSLPLPLTSPLPLPLPSPLPLTSPLPSPLSGCSHGW